ncbi:hypothetical protein ACFL7M_10650 [Thermodesulfobacteriota bacterium]
MIISTKEGETFDTETDLTAPERHILQKLFLWESMASGLEEFRNKKEEALLKGWNNSGPVEESPALKSITKEMENKIILRLNKSTP